VIDKDPDIFKNMRAYGCTTLQFGVEAGSQETLDNLKKNISIEQIFSAIKAAKASGIEVICSMLMGHPYDNKDTIMSSLEFAKKLVDLGAHTLFSIVCPYPGTQIEKKADFYGIKIHPVSYNDYFVSNAFIDTKNLTAKEIRNIYYNGMRDLVNYSKERKPEFFKSVFNEKIS
jgi:radical SAM superfamily enzyme YgiQ (UPF0313 family)